MGFTYAIGRDGYNLLWLGNHIRPGMTVFDIGANRGQTTLFFATKVGTQGRVFSFEPVPEIFRDLTSNIQINGLTNVEAHCCAIGSNSGDQAFAYSNRHQTSGKLLGCEPARDVSDCRTFAVQVKSLDELWHNQQIFPDFIKIDVEGGARLVLAGAKEVLSKFAPSIYVELHGGEEQCAIQNLLIEHGFVAETMTGVRIVDVTNGWYTPLWCYRPK